MSTRTLGDCYQGISEHIEAINSGKEGKHDDLCAQFQIIPPTIGNHVHGVGKFIAIVPPPPPKPSIHFIFEVQYASVEFLMNGELFHRDNALSWRKCLTEEDRDFMIKSAKASAEKYKIGSDGPMEIRVKVTTLHRRHTVGCETQMRTHRAGFKEEILLSNEGMPEPVEEIIWSSKTNQ